MKLKKILALVLVLALSAALIGCGTAAKTVDYQFILDACAGWVKDTHDLSALSKFMGGDFIGDELNTLMQMMVDEGFVELDDLTSGLDEELGVATGSDIKFSVAEETELDAEAIADYQADLDGAAEGLRDVSEQIGSIRDMLDSTFADMTEDEMAEIDADFQEENGMTVKEYLDLMNRMCDSFNALADKLDGATIDKGVTAKVGYDTDDGAATEDIDFLKIGDKWSSSYMIDMLTEMSNIA